VRYIASKRNGFEHEFALVVNSAGDVSLPQMPARSIIGRYFWIEFSCSRELLFCAFKQSWCVFWPYAVGRIEGLHT